MKAFICVDYLSHSWEVEDLLCSYSENKQQVAELRQRLRDNDDTIELERKKYAWCGPSVSTLKEQHRLMVEDYRLQRLQNALWRQMSKRCSENLGKSNRPINPWEVNWQKECDITWLYGPLYQRDENDDLMERCWLNEYPVNKRFSPPRPMDFRPSPKIKSVPPCQSSGAISPPLKPVLKHSPSVSRHAKFDSLIESWIGDADEGVQRQPRPKRANSWTGTHIPSSTPRTKSIRFSPHVVKVEYFPNHPILKIVPRVPPASSTSKASDETGPSMPPVKRKSSVSSSVDESLSLIKPLPTSTGLSEACVNLAATVKDIITLCGVIVIYRSISVGVSPIVWLAQHWVQHLVGNSRL